VQGNNVDELTYTIQCVRAASRAALYRRLVRIPPPPLKHSLRESFTQRF
jgi:hypothetical protein